MISHGGGVFSSGVMKPWDLMRQLPYIDLAAYVESQLSRTLFSRTSWVGSEGAGERGRLVWEQVYIQTAMAEI